MIADELQLLPNLLTLLLYSDNSDSAYAQFTRHLKR